MSPILSPSQNRKMSARFDVCVIGPVTWDIIETESGSPPVRIPGGVVMYAGLVYGRLGLKTAVITKAALADAKHITRTLRRSGVWTRCLPSQRTTVFHNRYTGRALNNRYQRVASLADPFQPEDLEQIDARVFHLGPLLDRDMDTSFLSAVLSRGERVNLDVQGLLRRAVDGDVQLKGWDNRIDLSSVDALKANWDEAQRLAGGSEAVSVARRVASLGPREVILTRGDMGALIVVENILYRIPAVRPALLRDVTGCGDTFFAGYTTRRLQSVDVISAGRFGSALAAVSAQEHGPWSGLTHDVDAALARPQGD